MVFPSIACHADSPEETFALILRNPNRGHATLDFEVDDKCMQIPIGSPAILDNIIAAFLDDDAIVGVFENMEIGSIEEAEEALKFALEVHGINVSIKGRSCRVLIHGIPKTNRVKILVADRKGSQSLEVSQSIFKECAEAFNRACSSEKLKRIGFATV